MMREYEDPFAEIHELFMRLMENSATDPSGVMFRAGMQQEDPGLTGMNGPSGVEVHKNGGEILLVTELPGFSEDQITVWFEGGRCLIEASDGDRICRKTALVPEPDPSSVRQTYRHGVLELVFRAKAEPVQQAGI